MKFIDLISIRRDPAPPHDLTQLDELVASVPPELVEYLRLSNGAALAPRDIAIATPWGGRHITVDEFWPVTALATAGNSIQAATRALRSEGMLPPTVLAIAGDTAASVICMSCESDSFGHIYLWDNSKAHPNTASVQTLADVADYLAPVASSLVDFASMMTTEAAASAAAPTLAATAAPPPAAPTPLTKPLWVDPAPLVDATPSAEVYLYRHKGEQPDVVLSRPLAPARSNSRDPLGPSWQTPTVSWHRPDTNSMDLIDANGLLLLRPNARDAIGQLLEAYGELLPVATDTGPLFAFRCLNIIDALSPTVSLINGKNGFVGISGFEFEADAIEGRGVFTLTQQPTKPYVFFTRPIVDAIIESDIRSLDFTKIW